MNSSIWTTDGILTGTTDQSGPGSNGTEEELHISQNSMTVALWSDAA